MVEDRNLPIHIILVNKVRSGGQLPMGEVQDILGYKISSVFTPAPELAFQALVEHTPMVSLQPDGINSQQFINLAEKVVTRDF